MTKTLWASECQKHKAIKAQICASLLSDGQIGGITILFNCAKSSEGNHSFVSECRSFWVDSLVLWCLQKVAELIFLLFGKGKDWKFWVNIIANCGFATNCLARSLSAHIASRLYYCSVLSSFAFFSPTH